MHYFRFMTASCRSPNLAGCLLIAVALTVLRPAAAAEPALLPVPQASYSAETTLTYGGDTLEMQTQHRGGWERQEFQINDLTQVTILRPDRNRAYVMFLESRQLFEVPYGEAALLPHIETLRALETEKLSDTEVDGEAVVHFQVFQRLEGAEEDQDEKESNRDPVVLDLWVTDDGIIMRAEGEILVDGYREPLQLMRRNVRRQTLGADLFEPALPTEP